MPKAAKKSTTIRKAKRAPERPRKGLAFIHAAYQRKSSPEPNLMRELKMRKQPADVRGLTALYDAYTSAARAIMAVVDQPRAQGIDDFIDAECNYMIAKAWTVAEHLKGLRPARSDREQFARVLVDCCFDMGGNADDGASVFKAALAVGTGDGEKRR